MYKILLASHGDLCKGMLDAGKMILGDVSNIEYVSLKEEGIDSFEANLKDKIKKISEECESILILTDLFGGTPFNKSLENSILNENLKVIAGLNLSMLIEASINSNKTLEEGYRVVLEAGSLGIRGSEKNLNHSEDE